MSPENDSRLRRGGGRRAPADAEREAVAGSVERVTFHNADNGFSVLQVRARGRRELVTVLGHLASISPGEFVHASGRWETSAQHGLQFRAQHLEVTRPTSVEGIRRYLGSGLIRGIGKEMARRLVAAFGEEVFDVVEHHPERLKTVDGIGPVRLQRILEGWKEQREIREIMLFLQANGVGTARAVRIYRTYGADAVPLISEDPYRLARDIRGIGFRTADQIAQRIGIARDAPVRARAGLSYTLLQAVGQGHCALPREMLLERAEELLEIPRPNLEEALRAELAERHLVLDELDGEPAVFLAALWQAERTVARRVRELAAGVPRWGAIEAEAAIPWAEARLGVELAPSQRRAVEKALGEKVLVITGGPGVGKTTLVNAILRIVRAKGVEVGLCAPTGRAAKRLGESTGLEAKTIHRLLEFDPQTGGFKRHREHPLSLDLLVVDEVSMVDLPLAASLLQAVPEGASLLLVGDVDQLPSVGPGQVLADVIDSGVVAVARLTEIFRQAAESRIVTTAHRVNQGLMPELSERADADGVALGDFFFVEAADPEDGRAKVLEIVGRRIPRRFGLDPFDGVQVLCPMNRGPFGARALNVALQESLNPPSRHKGQIERFGWTFRQGDKVMQVENDYDRDVFNGDVGRVAAVDADTQELVARFDGRSVVYRFHDLDQLVLAYATTIHKSQGSEYPAVVLTLAMQHFVMLRRNLLYTGITRGRQLVVLVGQQRALAMAVRGRTAERRFSKLRDRLAEGPAGS